jgi:predicted RNA binding protein YcfA (HicA-like mRNA interferase family)
MPRLRPLSAREVCRILEKHGFVIVRQKGSHIILHKEVRERGITVPVPNHAELAKRHPEEHHRSKRDPQVGILEMNPPADILAGDELSLVRSLSFCLISGVLRLLRLD